MEDPYRDVRVAIESVYELYREGKVMEHVVVDFAVTILRMTPGLSHLAGEVRLHGVSIIPRIIERMRPMKVLVVRAGKQ